MVTGGRASGTVLVLVLLDVVVVETNRAKDRRAKPVDVDVIVESVLEEGAAEGYDVGPDVLLGLVPGSDTNND